MAHPAFAHLEPDECDSQATDGVFMNTADQDCGTAVSGAALCTNLSTLVNSRLVCADAVHPLANPRRADALHTHPGPSERVGWSPLRACDLTTPLTLTVLLIEKQAIEHAWTFIEAHMR